MNRRHWLRLGGLTLLGTRGAAAQDTAKPAGQVLKAGEFSVTVPEAWKTTAVVSKVPLHPLYNEAEWKAYQADKRNILKPDYSCRPEHWAIRLPAASPEGITFDPKEAGDDPTAPQILIHKASEWAVVLTDGKHGQTDGTELLENLRKRMDASLTQNDPELMPAFMDASLTFRCLRRRLDFEGGHGIRMVAQWTIEPDLLRTGRLHYLFLGMSDDNSCQIIATFPISLPGLPGDEDNDAEHLGRSLKRHEALTAGFKDYEKEARTWLEEKAGEINPQLEALDGVMRSLVAKRWP